jgi:hypothetical protein
MEWVNDAVATRSHRAVGSAEMAIDIVEVVGMFEICKYWIMSAQGRPDDF